MDVTTTLTGMLPAAVMVSAALTAVTSVVVLWLYRRRVLRAMGQRTGAAEASIKQRGAPEAATASPLTIESQQGGTISMGSAAAQAEYRRAAYSLWAAAGVYVAGGVVYATILTAPWMITAGDGFILGRFLWLFACYAWPMALAVSVVAATSRGERVRVAAGYFAIVIVVALYVLVRNPDSSISQNACFWLLVNGPATVLLLAFQHRRVRAVGSMVLGFMVAGVAGAFVSVEAAGKSDEVLHGIVAVGDFLGLGAAELFALMNVVGFAAFGVIGWLLLGRIGRRYRAKRLSDQTLRLDSSWLLFAVVQSITFVFEGWGWIFTGLVAFAAYKLVTLAGFSLLKRRAASDNDAPMLLLLRVFALGRRSERFFDTFSKWWRLSGSISLIAGPDLVRTAVEPHEFLDFVGGRLSRHFVQGKEDLDRRLTELDRLPDPDGRYRVNEFFCHADTWQMTMRGLAKESDATLMDLRSFTPANHGCLYELEQLLDIVDLECVVFLVDETTNLPFLEETLQRLWQGVDRESPNRKSASPTVRLFHATDQSRESMRALHLMLLGARAAA